MSLTRRLQLWHPSRAMPVLILSLLTGAGCLLGTRSENPGSKGDGHYVVGPSYPIDPDLTDRGNPKGRQFEFKMRLADSKLFRGDDTTLEPTKKPSAPSGKSLCTSPPLIGMAPLLLYWSPTMAPANSSSSATPSTT